MSKRPLSVIAVFFIFGIVSAKYLPERVKFYHVLAVFLILVLFALSPQGRGRARNIFLFLSTALLSALLYFYSNLYPADHITNFLKDEKLKTTMIGIIKGPALSRKPYYGKICSTYLFKIERIGDINVTGLSRIRIQTENDYRYGDRVMVNGTIRRPADDTSRLRSKNIVRAGPKAESRTFNYREYLERQNIFALINTKESKVTVLARDYKSKPILKYIYLLREKLKNQVIEKMPPETGAFMRAILLGDRSELPKGIQTVFKNSGVMHILAISGLHVGIISLIIIYSFRLIGLKRGISYFLTILFLIFFVLLTLSNSSVVRSAVMLCVFLTGTLIGRKADAYNSLGAAAVFIMIRNPKDIFNVGFQLSFLAVLSILFLAPKFMKISEKRANFYVKKYFYAPLAVSISASAGTFPLILYYFRIITPVSVISNIFIIPLVFGLLISGLAFLVLGWIPFAGELLAGINDILARLIFKMADFFASMKYGHFYLG
jgi:competence protein ComEC